MTLLMEPPAATTPQGDTWAAPQIEAIYASGKMPPLLEGGR